MSPPADPSIIISGPTPMEPKNYVTNSGSPVFNADPTVLNGTTPISAKPISVLIHNKPIAQLSIVVPLMQITFVQKPADSVLDHRKKTNKQILYKTIIN
jgi:hypothetical protein